MGTPRIPSTQNQTNPIRSLRGTVIDAVITGDQPDNRTQQPPPPRREIDQSNPPSSLIQSRQDRLRLAQGLTNEIVLGTHLSTYQAASQTTYLPITLTLYRLRNYLEGRQADTSSIQMHLNTWVEQARANPNSIWSDSLVNLRRALSGLDTPSMVERVGQAQGIVGLPPNDMDFTTPPARRSGSSQPPANPQTREETGTRPRTQSGSRRTRRHGGETPQVQTQPDIVFTEDEGSRTPQPGGATTQNPPPVQPQPVNPPANPRPAQTGGADAGTPPPPQVRREVLE